MNYKNKIVILFVLIILIFMKGYLFNVKYKSDDTTKEYLVFIEKLNSISEFKISYNIRLLDTNDKFVLNIYNNSYDNLETDLSIYTNYKYGNIIKLKGKITIPKKLNNPGEFNYKQYLFSNNIYGLINTYEIIEETNYDMNFKQKIYSSIYGFKEYVKCFIENNMCEKAANVASAIIYGDTTNLDEDITNELQNIGASHLMSASGTNISVFILLINLILGEENSKIRNNKKYKNRKVLIKNDKVKGIIKILSIIFYIIFTGGSISILRAGIMLIVSIICDLLNINKNKYMSMLIAVLLILLNTPYAIFNTGFKLSFLATFGIMIFGKYMRQAIYKVVFKIKNEILKKCIRIVLESVAVTISVQLLIIPIQIQAFNKLCFPIIISNVILSAISMPIIILGTIGIVSLFIPFISKYIFLIVEVFVKLLIYLTNFFSKISFGISVASQPLMFFVTYYLAIICILIFLKLKVITSNKERKYNFYKLLKYLKKCIILFLLLAIVIVTVVNIYSIYFAEYVYFFNVEQGETSYIKSGNNGVIVDVGSIKKGLSYNTISNFFKISNINKVDAIIISHFHNDHINGLENVLKNYKVKSVFFAKPKTEDKSYTDFLKILEKYEICYKEVKKYDELNIGKIKINVLLPDEDYIGVDEENENSLICKISVNDKSLLYMGDASKNAENKLLKDDADISNIYILKVGHHGSKTATTEEFIKKTKPKYAIISALKKYYGHPHEITLDKLKLYSVYTYLTELNGAVKFNLK